MAFDYIIAILISYAFQEVGLYYNKARYLERLR